MYCILQVISCGYYKFQVEIGAATNQDFNIKIAHEHRFMIFNLVLRDDYPIAATIWGTAINQ